ncbi:hydrogenase formation protein HypD [Aneurinibacillus uraniidurans]|uniref:hydrogenase formation protein HypD n=1 Tax=Aneurinibacillus uraniidurans TaxID=2966586 RepID=UPI00234A4CBF|nr:hydrogenase formation protein HypD [Aneurinibacillus sp. B1]WCN37434.1 hydrogenase formation protein HypD [Aneurinibacillus sp. B1]
MTMSNLLAFRDTELSKKLVERLIPSLEKEREKLGRKLRFMEVCGTHTVAISKTGVRDILSPYVDLISGPGCPVCVTDQADIDHMIAFAKRQDVIVTTFGDMMKVPGSSSTLYEERANGADVRVVYAPSESVDIALRHPDKKIVFLGVGFETTAPGIALSMQRAKKLGVTNFWVYSAHKLTPPAVDILLQDSSYQFDGLLLPGNVSVIVGRRGWERLEKENIPAVIGGFEPVDLLSSISLLVEELNKEKRYVVNNYERVVKEDGNRKARELLAEVFSVQTGTWRGIGDLPNSGLVLSEAYRTFDAREHIEVEKPATKRIKGCLCGEIIKGKMRPFDCKLFAGICTPENPIGPCMVSGEGTCSTYYKYERGKVVAHG